MFLTNRLAACVLACALFSPLALAGPVTDALDELRRPVRQPSLEHRFFTKTGRAEISPVFGYETNNPFATRMLATLRLGYHRSETFSVAAQASWAPDRGEGDVKGLTESLVNLGSRSGSLDFTQAFDKLVFAGDLGLTWAPVYGKLNLVGEAVLNFDAYADVGLGVRVDSLWEAAVDPAVAAPDFGILLFGGQHRTALTPHLGAGANFFVTRSLAVKLDARFSGWVDGGVVRTSVVTSAGLALFAPRMKVERIRY